MSLAPFDKLTTFLKQLEGVHLHYTLASHRDDTIMVLVTVPGERWEIGVSSLRAPCLVGESPTEVRSSSLVAWEAPWREIKTVKPSDTMLFGSMRETPGCNVQ